MDIKIMYKGNIKEYEDVTNLKETVDGWIEFDCPTSASSLFPISSSLLGLNEVKPYRVKGEIIEYIDNIPKEQSL